MSVELAFIFWQFGFCQLNKILPILRTQTLVQQVQIRPLPHTLPQNRPFSSFLISCTSYGFYNKKTHKVIRCFPSKTSQEVVFLTVILTSKLQN